MKVHEFQAKEILKGYGVPVPKGRVAGTPEEARRIAEEIGAKRVVVKAQIHAGGRGKAAGFGWSTILLPLKRRRGRSWG